jgi:hypothetical protein
MNGRNARLVRSNREEGSDRSTGQVTSRARYTRSTRHPSTASHIGTLRLYDQPLGAIRNPQNNQFPETWMALGVSDPNTSGPA